MSIEPRTKMKLFPIFAVVLAGCASSPESLHLNSAHPASPDAEQTPFVAEHNALLAITNSIDVRSPARTAGGEHEHGQEGHEKKGKP